MKTTLIGFGKCGEEVIKKCHDLPDTEFVLFSDEEAPSFVYSQQAQNELVITVSYAKRTEEIRTTGIRKDYSVNISLVDIGLRSSPTYNGLLNVEFIILPFKHIDMLTELHEMHADRNVVFTPEIGGKEKEESAYLRSCIAGIIYDIRILKSIAEHTGCDGMALQPADIQSVFGHADDTYKVINDVTDKSFEECFKSMYFYLKQYLKISPKRLLCHVITPEPLTPSQIEKLQYLGIEVKIGVTTAPEESTIKISYIAAFKWSSSDHISEFWYKSY